METSERHLIEALYSASCTPRTSKRNYDGSGNLRERVDTVFKSSTRKVRIPSLSDEFITQLIHFFAICFDVPDTLAGIGLMRPPLLATSAVFVERAKTDHRARQQVMAVLETVFDTLAEASSDRLTVYNSPPLVSQSHIYYMHYSCWKSSILPDSSFPFYRAYVPEFHCKIRIYEEKRPEVKTFQNHVLAIRQFYAHTPQDIKEQAKHPAIIPDSYLNRFASEFSRAQAGSSAPEALTLTAIKYKSMIAGIRDMKDARHRAHGDREKASPEEVINEETETDEDTDVEVGSIHSVHLDHPSTEAVLDYPLPELQLANPDLPLVAVRVPKVRLPWLDIIHLRNYIFFFDLKYLTLAHYAAIYRAMEDLQGKGPLNERIALFLYLLIHTGIDHRLLLTLTTVLQSASEGTPVLRRAGDRYFIQLPLILERASRSYPGCSISLASILLPLPEKICSMVRSLKLLSGKPVFRFTQEGKEIGVDLHMLRDFVDQRVNRHPDHARFDLRITLSRIRRSFPAFYCSRYGMDPIVTALARGDRSEHLHRSQAHYTYVFRHDFEQQYISTFDKADAQILKAAGSFRGTPRSGAPPSHILDCGVEPFVISSTQAASGTTEGYGSQIIPSTDLIRTAITGLRSEMYRDRDPITRYNLLVQYSYLACQFAFALRPRNDPGLTWRNYDSLNRLILVADKESRSYHEQRIVHVPPVIGDILGTLQLARQKTTAYALRNIDPTLDHGGDGRIFHFLTPGGAIVPYTVKEAARMMRESGVQLDLPPNMPRHFTRNALFHAGITNDAIDAWLGHAHAGRELFGYASSACLADVSAQCLPVIEHLLAELGFSDMRRLWR